MEAHHQQANRPVGYRIQGRPRPGPGRPAKEFSFEARGTVFDLAEKEGRECRQPGSRMGKDASLGCDQGKISFSRIFLEGDAKPYWRPFICISICWGDGSG